MRDDRGAAAQDGVAGQHRVRAVAEARTTPSPACGPAWPAPAAARRRPSITSPSTQRPRRRGSTAGSSARTGAPVRSCRPAARLAVVEVAVREQHERDRRAPRPAAASRCASSAWPGSTTIGSSRSGRAQQPGVGAVERHRAGVVLQQHRRQRRHLAQRLVGRVRELTAASRRGSGNDGAVGQLDRHRPVLADPQLRPDGIERRRSADAASTSATVGERRPATPASTSSAAASCARRAAACSSAAPTGTHAAALDSVVTSWRLGRRRAARRRRSGCRSGAPRRPG